MNTRIKNKKRKQEMKKLIKRCCEGKSFAVLNNAEMIIEFDNPIVSIDSRPRECAEINMRATLLSINTPKGRLTTSITNDTPFWLRG